jgi:hypothetical protein
MLNILKKKLISNYSKFKFITKLNKNFKFSPSSCNFFINNREKMFKAFDELEKINKKEQDFPSEDIDDPVGAILYDEETQKYIMDNYNIDKCFFNPKILIHVIYKFSLFIV